MRTSRGKGHLALHGMLVFVALSLPAAVRAQWGQVPRTNIPTPGGTGSNSNPDREDEWHDREMQEKLQRTREKDRQKRIVDDANRLVELTAQYRKQVAAHGTATQEDQKLLVDIEKLAREVKDRMRGN